MAGTITALQFQKRNENRVNVYLDGEFAFGLAAIEAAHLRVGQVLSDDDVAGLRRWDEVEQAYERTLHFLSYRPRSEAEVRRRMRQKNEEDEVIEAVVERLTRAGMLNEREFARYWVENRLQFSPRGIRALNHELREKGVPASIIADTLAGLDEQATARQALEAGGRRLAHPDPRVFRRRLEAYLARRGFSYEVIVPLVEEMLETVRGEALSDIESEG